MALHTISWGVLVFWISTCWSLRIQLFEDPNYSNFLQDVEVKAINETDCIPIYNLKPVDYSPFVIGSLKTEKCIMLYTNPICKVDTFNNSFRFTESVPRIPETIPRDWSLHVCSNARGGGPEVNVDFYSEREYLGNISVSYRNVCGCRNLPAHIKGTAENPISVNNQGNSIEVYKEEQCQGTKQLVEAGSNELSRTLVITLPFDRLRYNIRSFKPAGPLECLKLDASIYKFSFTNATGVMNGSISLKTENVKLAANTILRSNGSAKLVQEYTVSSKVTETLDYTIATGFSNMHSVSVHAGYEAEVKGGVPFFAEGSSKWKLDLTYQYQRTDTGSTSNRTTTSNEEAISIRQNIEIQPCTECVVSSFVKKVKDFPIEYKAFSRVKGTAGDERLTAAEDKTYLEPGAEYVRDYDAYTVETMVKGVMYAEYGLNTFISAECEPIPGCVTSLKVAPPPTSSHFVIEQPTLKHK